MAQNKQNWKVKRWLGKIRSLKELKKDIRCLSTINFKAGYCYMKQFWQTPMLNEEIYIY